MSMEGGSIFPMLTLAYTVVAVLALGLAYLLAPPLRRALGPSARLVLGSLATLALAFGVASLAFARRSGNSWWLAYGEESAFWAIALGIVLLALAWQAGRPDTASR